MNTQSEQPLVSVCVPIYGVEKWIERCARSLFEQTYENLEFIFVNDCTPDRSIEILQKVLEDYPTRKPQTRILTHEKNRGLSAARNTAIEAVRGEFLVHVDSDDAISLDLVEKLLFRQQERNSDIVSCGYCIEMSDGSNVVPPVSFENQQEALFYLLSDLAHNHYIWGRLIRTKLYRDHNILAKEGLNIGEDLQVVSQLCYYAQTFNIVDEPLYQYNRTNETALTLFISDKVIQSDVETFQVLKNFFKDKEQEYIDLIYRCEALYEMSILEDSCRKGIINENYDYIAERLSQIHSKYYTYDGLFKKYAYKIYRYPRLFILYIKLHDIIVKTRQSFQ